ncbi:MAG: protein translocase subunit SecD [Polyangiaceae bacterium]|nr:protein translocase subunit SecD [Polyangiaceae bacterium]
MLHNVFVFGFAGVALLCVLGAWISRPNRTIFGLAAAAAGGASIAAYNHAFWAFAVLGLCVPWLVFCAMPWIDLAWRAKTGFVLFLTLGSALVIFPTYHDERHGRVAFEGTDEEQAEQLKKAQRGELGFKNFILTNVPFRLVRGLDLKGGLRLVYTVDVEEAIKDKRDYYYDQIRASLTTKFGFHEGDKAPTVAEMGKLSEKLTINKPRERVDEIVLAFNDPADSAKLDDELLKKFTTELNVLRSADKKTVTFRLKGEKETEIRDRAVALAKDTVQRRVDGFGVKEVGIASRDEDIILEIPGENEAQFKEIREIVSQTARLDFKMVDDDHDFFAAYENATDVPAGLRFERENAPLGAGKTKPVTYAFMPRAEGEKMQKTLERMRAWTEKLQVPTDNEISFQKVVRYDPEKAVWEDEGWRTFYLHAKAEVTGDMIREAQAMPDQSERSLGGWLVRLEFTPVGAERFEDVTGKNVKRRFAVVLDGKVESAPVIQTKIGGGTGVITMGAGSLDEQQQAAKNLELVLRSGALPAPISPSNEQRIGPSLGQDAIVAGMKGGASGAILVLIFMAIYYSRAGWIANIAVLFNLVLQIAILAMFGASMTLPGIAGLTLTIGIAVDANVLINERIREELRQGKSPRQAVDVGYDKAFSAILDGHVTTLISGLILAQYGTGPIKGFAVTLIVGIAVSLFTGVVCTRLMFDWAVRGRKTKKLHVG